MTNDESSFVEAMGQYLGSVGMTPMAGRMWGWLLICVPPEQTAGELAEALQASRGAISGTARLLESAGLIRRTRKGGDRREFFSAPPGTFKALVQNAGAIYRRFREVTEYGLGVVADLPPPMRLRLEEVHDYVQFAERQLPALLEAFAHERTRGVAAATDGATTGPGAKDATRA